MQLRSIRRKAGLGAALGVLLTSGYAHARRPQIHRHGGQWGAMVGGSACIPGERPCRRDGSASGGLIIDGDLRPSFGTAAELGYRFNPYIFLGASYHFGMFNPDYRFSDGSDYRFGYQHSVYAMVRPILPVWRFDFGLGLGPGFSRQTFRQNPDRKDYSQGFSWLISPTIDIFVTRRFFLGTKVDIMLNVHRDTCRRRGDDTNCRRTEDFDLGPVHQILFGFHLGGTFL